MPLRFLLLIASAGLISASQPMLNGNFIDFTSVSKGWSQADWSLRFDSMAALKENVIVVQHSMWEDVPFYPGSKLSTITWGGASDPIGKVLNEADSRGFQVGSELLSVSHTFHQHKHAM